MPRASRHYLPGYVWHITHRCHKKEFLLKFAWDSRRWLQWLFEAKKRYDLSMLNYMVTSNHIHLLVRDNGDRDAIPKSIQLIAGRAGQEYNLRKKRKGAYWEDRYHATAVKTDRHLVQCLVYIDLNMVRAGVVKHPSEWSSCGYNEIQDPRERYRLIDYEGLKDLLGFWSMDDLKNGYRRWVEESVKEGNHFRDGKWTEISAEKDAVPGSVIAIQSFGDFLGFNTHLHVLGTDGCFYGEGMFRPALARLIGLEADNPIFGSLNDLLLMSRITRSGPGVAPRFHKKDLEKIFRHKVFKMLLSKGKITEDLINMLCTIPNLTFRVYRTGDRSGPGNTRGTGPD